ncbi:hypothetical protein ACEWY4_011612 [Coilia grayii]|uniref:Paralemmin n=1 Tax=Coilia grayii TaxID=363190 RepID=A0ABD1JY76_9TELE
MSLFLGDVDTTKSTKTQKVTNISAATTVCHGEVGQRTAKLYEVRGKVIYKEYSGEASSAGKEACEGEEEEDGQVKLVSPLVAASNGGTASGVRDQAGVAGAGEARGRGAWSGPEDDVTEERDLISADKSSSLSFLEWQNRDDSDAQTTVAVEVDVKTEVVLIDEDDDMSLREKTVTDVSLMDGNAAELVCGRLRSGSTASSSLCKEESLATETPLPPIVEIKKGRCCCCTII